MKKYVVMIMFLLLVPFKVLANSSYIVMDGYSGRVLEGSNINDEMLIASTTKIMTAMIAIENADLDSKVTISKDVLKAYGSNIYIEVGEEISLRDLLYGLLLRSGNDAAIEIARFVGGSMEEFANLMNRKAHELGMNNTNFINSSGLEDENKNGNTSTAYDMALLMSYAIKNEEFVKITGTKKHIVTTNYKTYEWHNKNRLLSSYKYCIGGKTGFTKLARRTLVTAAKKDDKLLVVVTLNDGDDFNTHKYLYEKNFKNYNLVKIIEKGNIKIDNNIFYDNLYIEDDIKALLTRDEEKKIKVEYELEKKNNYSDNEIVGSVLVKIDNKLLLSRPIYVLKDNKEIKNEKKSWLQKIIDFLIFWR